MYTLNKLNSSKHFFNNQKLVICLAVICLLLSAFQYTVYAQNLPCQTATASGHYRHPLTGIIEDSGGDSSEALGQSMVANVVDSQALIESNPNGTYLISLRFKLMNSLSDIKLSFQTQNSDSWTSVSYKQTAKGDDTGDLRFEVPSTDIIVKAECMVEAMGRYVIFYITLSNFTDGNTADFVQTSISDDSNIKNDNDNNEAYDSKSDDTLVSNSDEVLNNVVSVSELLQSEEGLTIGNSTTQVSSGATAISEEPVAQSASTTINAETIQELNISSTVWFMLFIIVLCANILGGLCLWGLKTIITYFAYNKKPKKEFNSNTSIDINDSIQSAGNDICNIDDIDLMKGFIYDEDED